MPTKTYVITRLLLTEGKSGEGDKISEFYGNFSYRAEGQSSWTTLVETSDASPWNLQDPDTDFTSGRADPEQILVHNQRIDVPNSSTFIEIRASIKEYDPSVFDADEDLGTSTISLPLTNNSVQKKIHQGDRSTGELSWLIDLMPEAEFVGRIGF